MSAVTGDAVALIVCRDGRLPAGASEAVAEAGGRALVVGTGSDAAATELPGLVEGWWATTGTGPVALADAFAPALEAVRLVVTPASPDGRDLAPRLAARLGRPLLAGAVRAVVCDGGIEADLLRVDGRVVVPVRCAGTAVATLLPGARSPLPETGAPVLAPLDLAGGGTGAAADSEVVSVLEPDPATMDLVDATRVIGGGAGLVPRAAGDDAARSVFDLLGAVAAALGASPGATRVVTDAGWMPYDRQIGTTGVAVDPDLYVALGVSGASQHVGGLGDPRHTVSVNTDASAPMTAMADLGLVTDALSLLVELARRLDVDVNAEVDGLLAPSAGKA